MPRRARDLLAWCVLLADEDGVVLRSELAEVLDAADPENLRERVAELEGFGHIRRMRKPAPYGSRIKVVWSAAYGKMWKRCKNCPRPVKNVRGARYCATCQAGVARHDRAWKALAFEIWADGCTEKQSEAKIVYRIGAATGHPMFTPRDAGADQKREGIVPYMLREGMLVDGFWRDRMRAYSGNEGDDVA